MVAAVLDLHIGARLGAEALDQMAGGLPHRHDVVDLDPLGVAAAETQEGPRFGLLLIADDVIDLVHGGEAGRIDLRGAAGDHDLGVRTARGAPCRIACRAWRTLSCVTAQVLTITVAPSPASLACLRMTSDS